VRVACEQPHSGVRNTAAIQNHPPRSELKWRPSNRCRLRLGLSRSLLAPAIVCRRLRLERG
jgi:hypothetical protein